ncbi:KilA-N domain-containing protein [Bifidobacterium sp. ESL0790]|uniref:KilA-N domain-containing protein n=1 Tax=Bifidobacterium sp. ESL0790 TaxID=2983233 RepID=UPI0023F984ED|nr:KilA-N domain-containing protein [Bifidobacterium sp. ESL0790]WEV73010.1 KilA-N domain-containing protein [Bifidobacterium sp. ESL0790]
MTVDKSSRIHAEDVDITIHTVSGQDFISLTDMARHLGASPGDVIRRWLRLADTIDFLSAWESLANPLFDKDAAESIRGQAGKNVFSLSAGEWISKTNAIGIRSSKGRNGGTYAHTDIAFAFASWISPEFHLFVIKDYERLKTAEKERLGVEWHARRELAKTNYRLHTDSVKGMIEESGMSGFRERLAYASEADVINLAVFGQKASSWRKDHEGWKGNMRDYAPASELVILQNIEALSSVLIREGKSKEERFRILLMEAQRQREVLKPDMPSIEKIQRIIDDSEKSDKRIGDRKEDLND